MRYSRYFLSFLISKNKVLSFFGSEKKKLIITIIICDIRQEHIELHIKRKMLRRPLINRFDISLLDKISALNVNRRQK